jgi:acetylornithine/succinyldiaminopimelate/putrescine aminotransferase
LIAAVDERTAAVVVEAVQGEGGIHPLDSGLLEAARTACDEHGALLICDEIQCGLGRTGAMWGFEHAGIRPDVMTLAKGLAGGLPMGACVTNPDTADVLQPGDHGSTFGGGAVQSAAANAVLDGLPEHERVRAAGDRLRLGLEALGLQVRGIGLMLAFATPDGPGLVKRALSEQRLVLNATGPDTVRLLPPLNVSDAEIDDAVRRIGALV